MRFFRNISLNSWRTAKTNSAKNKSESLLCGHVVAGSIALLIMRLIADLGVESLNPSSAT